jgi:hypothetical protein
MYFMELPSDLLRLSDERAGRKNDTSRYKAPARMLGLDQVARTHARRFGVGHLGIEVLPALMREVRFVNVQTRWMRLSWLPGVPRAAIVVAIRAADQ